MDPSIAKEHDDYFLYRNNPNNYKSVYSLSFKNVPTYYASPLFEEDRKQKGIRDVSPLRDGYRHDNGYVMMTGRYGMGRGRQETERQEIHPRDISPYREPLSYRSQQDQEHERGNVQARSRYDEEYDRGRETHISRYDQEFDRRNDFREALMINRNGEPYERSSPRQEKIQEKRIQPNIPPEELTWENDGEFDNDPSPKFCNRCFRTNVCINKFRCGHQYCDQCLRQLKGAENPFRGSWIWQYKCGICKTDEWCSEQRLIKYNPAGKRVIRYKDVKYFDS